MNLPRIPPRLMPVAVLAVGVLGFFLLLATRPAPMPAEVRERAWTVAVETVTPASQAPLLILYGTVDSPRSAELTAAVAAYVAEVPVREGAVVAAGARGSGGERPAQPWQRCAGPGAGARAAAPDGKGRGAGADHGGAQSRPAVGAG